MNTELNTQKFALTQATNRAVQSDYELRKYIETEERIVLERKQISHEYADTKVELDNTSVRRLIHPQTNS